MGTTCHGHPVLDGEVVCGGLGTRCSATPITNGKTDESVPGFMDGNDMNPTLKRGVHPNRESLKIIHRNNPPIHWWDGNATIPPKINRFNGLYKSNPNQSKYEEPL